MKIVHLYSHNLLLITILFHFHICCCAAEIDLKLYGKLLVARMGQIRSLSDLLVLSIYLHPLISSFETHTCFVALFINRICLKNNAPIVLLAHIHLSQWLNRSFKDAPTLNLVKLNWSSWRSWKQHFSEILNVNGSGQSTSIQEPVDYPVVEVNVIGDGLLVEVSKMEIAQVITLQIDVNWEEYVDLRV